MVGDRHQPSRDEKHGLFVLHPKGEDAHADVDIIAIHGLGGDAFETWTDAGYKLWLRDFVPNFLPKARIMTFGYDSKWAFSRSVAGIDDFALDLLNRLRSKRWSIEAMQRPVVFVCHSLGGIVCKKALIIAKDQRYYSNILDKSRGIIFFGTPHRGSRVASWATIMSNFINTCSFHKPMRNQLFKVLSQNSAVLADVSTSFKSLALDLQIVTFYETEIMNPLKGLVVEKESAFLGINNERLVPMAADHRNIVRFNDLQSQKFEPVRHALLEVIQGHPEDVQQFKDAYSYLMEEFNVTNYLLQYSSVHQQSPGTCEWITAQNSFKLWLRPGASEILWLRGTPGVGKTILMKYLISTVIPSRRILSHAGPSSNSGEVQDDVLAYFFCNEQDAGRQSMFSLLKTVMHQLLQLEPDLTHALIAKRISTTMGPTYDFLENPNLLWVALQDLIIASKMKTIYFVFDALDEMDPGHLEKLTENLRALIDTVTLHIQPRRLQILIASRPSAVIDEQLDCPSIAVRSERDVKHFIQKNVQQFRQEHMLNQDIADKIVETICKKAGTMFLWAKLVWNQFSQDQGPWSTQKVEAGLKALRILPSRLDPLYESILARFEGGTLTLLIRVFSWLLVTTRPLNTAELEIAIRLEANTLGLDEILNEFPGKMHFATICPNLIHVDATDHVHFVHQSFCDFLLSPSTNDRHHITLFDAHRSAALTCLSTFTLYNLEAGKIRDRISEKGLKRPNALEECELLFYAAKNWPHHASLAGEALALWAMFKQLYESRDSFGLWMVLYLYDDSHHKSSRQLWADSPLPPPLHVAVTIDNKYLIECVLLSGCGINEKDHTGYFHGGSYGGGTVLHISGISTEMVEFLISKGADISISNEIGRTPLRTAIDAKNEELCRILMQNDNPEADSSFLSKAGGAALLAAIDNQDSAVAGLFLADERIDLAGENTLREERSTQGIYLVTPLEYACLRGIPSMARLLLSSERMIEAQGRKELKYPKTNPTSLLFLAILQGWEELSVEIMDLFPTALEQDRDKDRRTVLHHAVIEHWHEVLERCIAKMKTSKLNMMDKNGRTALHHAASTRNWYAAARLLEVGAQPDVPDHDGKTPAHVAAEIGSERVLRLMLERKAVRPSELDNEKRTVLHYAATWDLINVCELLISSNEVDFAAKDRHGRNAAHLAALFGCPNVLGLLLGTRKIEINTKDYYGNSLLHCAVEGRNINCVEELLRREGLEINTLNRRGKAPLDMTYSDPDPKRLRIMREHLEGSGAIPGLWRPERQPYFSGRAGEVWKREYRPGWEIVVASRARDMTEEDRQKKLDALKTDPRDGSEYEYTREGGPEA
jgi:ankyrin repeat protein